MKPQHCFVRVAILAALTLAILPVFPVYSGQAPQRIVSISAPVTEIVFALGAGDRVVAVDTTSQYPEAAARRPKVGYMRTLAAEGILSLEPDLLLVPVDAGPPHVLSQIRQAGVRVETLPTALTLETLRSNIHHIGNWVHRPQEADDLAKDLMATLNAIQRPAEASAPGVLYLLSAGAGPPIAAGRKTVVDYLIQQAGGRNVSSQTEGFKPLSGEGAMLLAPDILLLGDHTLGPDKKTDAIIQLPQIAPTPAARNKRVVVIDSTLLMGLGPRTPRAIMDLARSFGTAGDEPWPAH